TPYLTRRASRSPQSQRAIARSASAGSSGGVGMDKRYVHYEAINNEPDDPEREIEMYYASDVDARIAELEGLLHDLLLVDESIGSRLRLPHGWSDEDKRRHALELTAREQKRTDARKAIGL